MSLRKRSHSFHYLNYSSWRILHISLGGFVLLILALHTGLAFGHNLNQLLGIDFTVLALCGALTGIGVAKEGGSNHQWASRLRRWGYWGHVILFWPLPVLLAFHILVSYYF
jgi:nitrite reductase (NADH) large subunit